MGDVEDKWPTGDLRGFITSESNQWTYSVRCNDLVVNYGEGFTDEDCLPSSGLNLSSPWSLDMMMMGLRFVLGGSRLFITGG